MKQHELLIRTVDTSTNSFQLSVQLLLEDAQTHPVKQISGLQDVSS